jgi:beta-phosphoglucomutase-like phosphatase (HAD superfamily)
MTQIRGVIFDVDGTLVDSNDAHAHAWVEAMEEQGYHISFEGVRPLTGWYGWRQDIAPDAWDHER